MYFAFALSQTFNHRNSQSQLNGLPLRRTNIPVLKPANTLCGINDISLFSSLNIASELSLLNKFTGMLLILLPVRVSLLSELRFANVSSRMSVKKLFASDKPCKENVPRKACPENVFSLL